MKLSKLLAASSAAALAATSVAQAGALEDMIAQANAELAAAGENYRIEMAETIVTSDAGGEEMGQTIFFNNRGNKQLAFDFVPGDPRRAGWSGPGSNITFAVDNINSTADIAGNGEFVEIRAAMATWEGVQCSTIPISDLGDTNADIGIVQFQLGHGGIPAAVSDIVHAGFLPPSFFLLLGSSSILGVTFTFIFVDGNGAPTDIDNNGTGDAALREIYYNDGFFWETDPNDQPGDGRFDIQTVSLHEAGHGLSQGHFGALKQTNSNGKLHFSPLAVMNAGYVFGQQQLAGTDKGGHCSNWASWPNN